MANTTCSVDGCEQKVLARGLCNRHYKHWRTAFTAHEWEATKTRAFTDEERKRRRGASAQKYKDANREVINEASRRWRQQNPDKQKSATKRWQDNNKTRIRQYARAYGAANAERRREVFQKWAAANRDRINASAGKRRARLLSVEVNDFTVKHWRELLAEYNHRCYYCGTSERRLQREHLTPLVRGGNHTKSNIVPACWRCNRAKFMMTADEFFQAGREVVRECLGYLDDEGRSRYL